MSGAKKDKLSWEVNVQVLPSKGLKLKLEPDEEQLALIGKAANLLSVERFVADITFKRWQKKGIAVTGNVFAQITQECVVTLEPVSGEVNEEIDRIFVPQGSKFLKPKLDDAGELVLDYDGRDEPEMFGGVTLDAWEIVMEHFTLGIDPFPRKEGVEFQAMLPEEKMDADDDKVSPFASLKDLFKP